MWVTHEPGKCTNERPGKQDNHESDPGTKNAFNRQALTSILKRGDLSEDEVESKVDAMIAVMDS